MERVAQNVLRDTTLELDVIVHHCQRAAMDDRTGGDGSGGWCLNVYHCRRAAMYGWTGLPVVVGSRMSGSPTPAATRRDPSGERKEEEEEGRGSFLCGGVATSTL